MNSPDQTGSPLSSPSSGSHTPEETGPLSPASVGTGNLLSSVVSNLSSQGGGGVGKRRMHFATGGSTRDVKSRRREDHRKGAGGGGSSSGAHGGPEMWEGKASHGSGKKDKEDLLDYHIVEYLKREIGDPFLEATFGLPR
ncbi:hypothetical protein E1B28_009351 [Marasmius oreades]|uniref:Uncharacterized protein n=1 Tax=Marasmius oreades TaxID=181124 RepID=A0A9P7S0C2_9AGAR|nr:uncharacterized protein E1B28_009351 [Marasmius oreades]KAG7093059.1 hypothetical protein E1B28_009351 [Marasmius oreades]